MKKRKMHSSSSRIKQKYDLGKCKNPTKNYVAFKSQYLINLKIKYVTVTAIKLINEMEI